MEIIATLSAMFKLYDGYSNSIDKINRKTNEATNKILKASGTTDNFNKKLKATGASANTASTGLGKFISIAAMLAGAVKGMSIIDEYTNTSARLNLINDGLQTQAELQEKIFAAANRAKGAYGDMANAISKMGLLAGEAFSSNDELIAFTELIQKSFKVGGAKQTEQSSAMLQLSQAMAAGRLQGDEFTSIMENAPMIAEAIALYTGKSKGELKELSSEGLITSDIIKNAMFAMGDDINAKFKSMPMTFADIWNKIRNSGTQAFSGVMEGINKIINTKGFQSFINGVITGIYLIGEGVGWLLDVSAKYWSFVGPVLAAIGSFLLTTIITKLWAMVVPLLIDFKLMSMLSSPIFLTVLAIGLMVSALNLAGVTMQDVFGFIGGSIGVLLALFTNLGIAIVNTFISIGKIIETVIYGAINFVLKGVNAIIERLNKIPGVNIGTVGEVKGTYSQMDYLDYKSLSDAYTKGSNVGKDVYTGASNKLKSFTDSFSDGLGTIGKPLKIEGTGKNGAIDVNMADEDLKYLRDVAERDYVNKFSTATLAPQISVSVAEVKETTDLDGIVKRIGKLLKEEIETAGEGLA